MTTTQDHRPVVVGVDGTEHSTAALRHALTDARDRGVGLRIVHVEPGFRTVTPHVLMIDSDVEAIGRHILRDAEARANELAPDVHVEAVLRRGPRVLELVAASESAQLIVLGSESMRGLDRFLLGTTTAGVAAHAACPVRVVPVDWVERPGPVVVGVRTAGQVESLVGRAVDLAGPRGAHVVVVHSWHLPDPYADRIEARVHASDWRQAGLELLETAVEPLRRSHPDVGIVVQVVHADPATALLAVPNASLVLVERAHRASWLPGSLGRTARHLLSRSSVPVQVEPVTGRIDEDGSALELAGSLRR